MTVLYVGYISKFSSCKATGLWCRSNDMSSTDPDYENFLSHPGEFKYIYTPQPRWLCGACNVCICAVILNILCIPLYIICVYIWYITHIVRSCVVRVGDLAFVCISSCRR